MPLALLFASQLWSCSSTDASPPNGTAGDGGDGSVLGDGAIDGNPFPPGCEKSPSEDSAVVRDDCGIFVAAGSAGGDGTHAKPFATIAQGISKAQQSSKNRVYVCAGGYNEAVLLDKTSGPVSIFGGIDCAAAKYDAAKKVTLTSNDPSATLKITGLKGSIVRVEDIDITAADMASAPKGASSVGVFVGESDGVTLRRVKVTAQDGKAGDSGGTGSNYNAGLLGSDPSIKGHDATAGTTAAGVTQDCTGLCTNGVKSTGGHGGAGDGSMPSPGVAGAPAYDAGAQNGAGGVQEPLNAGSCGSGVKGADAPASVGGAGAGQAGAVTKDGWQPVAGQDGTAGAPGQGGGGGGGGTYSGAPSGGGGGGGCGGCGGAPGLKGQSGGSSIAVLMFQSSVTLDGCTVSAGAGGTGGQGGPGQAGQLGGDRGTQQGNGCPGGAGGRGGQGGGGGGGAGGHSIAIGYVGNAPTQANGTTTNFVQTKANGGGPGTPAAPGNQGQGAQGQTGGVIAL